MHARLFLCFPLLALRPPAAPGQHATWDVSGLRAVSTQLSRLPNADQISVSEKMHAKAADLRAEWVDGQSGRVLVVQGVGNFFCGGSGNCTFAVMDEHYTIVLKTIAQQFEVQQVTHHGRPDIVTSMHGSAVDSELNVWHFNGKSYERAACADVAHGDLETNRAYARPRVTEHPCR